MRQRIIALVGGVRMAMHSLRTVAWPVVRPFAPAFGVVLTFLAVETAVEACSPFVWGKLTDALVDRHASRAAVLFGVMLTVGIIPKFLQYLRDHFEIDHIDVSVSVNIMSCALERISGFSMSQVADAHTGKTQTIVGKGRDALQQLVRMTVYNLGPTLLELGTSIVALLWCSALLGSVTAAGSIAYLIVAVALFIRHRAPMKEIEKRSTENGRLFADMLGNMELVMANARERTTLDEFARFSEDAAAVYRRFWHDAIKWYYGRNLAAYLLRFGSIGLAAYLLFNNRFSFGVFIALNAWIGTVVSATQRLGQMQREFAQCWAKLSLYLDFLKQESTIRIAVNATKPHRLRGSIEFRDIVFRYDPRKTDDESADTCVEDADKGTTALDHVSFRIASGEKVALVGESGAGKSTIAGALMRSRDPQEGAILLDNTDLRTLDLEAVRRRIGYVPQKPQLFDNTLRYNLLFGLNGEAASVTDEQLRNALFTVKLEHLAEGSGLDRKLGENGHTLSGGECQRVCIARALLKEPDVLIFDEATSSLDPVNEKKVQDAIDAVEGRTRMIIAHRYSTIRNVDRILVFDKGKLVNDGTHDELLERSVYYRALLEQQGLL